MIIDHVVYVVRDPIEAARDLFARHGLGSERGDYHTFSGTRNWSVPLAPPTYLEILSIENRTVAAASKAGQEVVAFERSGGGLMTWAVLVEDVTAVSRRLGIDVFDYTITDDAGTVRGWRSVTGPRHLPFFIDWPNSEGRLRRWDQKYQRVGHTSAPIAFSSLTISGSASEMRDWLGPHDLPLRFVDGNAGLVEARIATASGDEIVIP